MITDPKVLELMANSLPEIQADTSSILENAFGCPNYFDKSFSAVEKLLAELYPEDIGKILQVWLPTTGRGFEIQESLALLQSNKWNMWCPRKFLVVKAAHALVGMELQRKAINLGTDKPSLWMTKLRFQTSGGALEGEEQVLSDTKLTPKTAAEALNEQLHSRWARLYSSLVSYYLTKDGKFGYLSPESPLPVILEQKPIRAALVPRFLKKFLGKV